MISRRTRLGVPRNRRSVGVPRRPPAESSQGSEPVGAFERGGQPTLINRARQQVALYVLATELAQYPQLFWCLHALGNNADAEVVGQRYNRPDDFPAVLARPQSI